MVAMCTLRRPSAALKCRLVWLIGFGNVYVLWAMSVAWQGIRLRQTMDNTR